MGGAGVALPQDSLVAATNPAGMVFVGSRYDIGLELFNPHRCYEITGNAFAGMNSEQCSDKELFFVPHMAANWMLGSDSSFGVTVYGNGGMSTRYNQAVFGAFGGGAPTGVDLMQLFIALTYSKKITPTSSVGISLIPVAQMFEAYGLQPFQSVSSDPQNVTNTGYDSSYGLGFKFGGQVDVGGGVTLGASWQPMINRSRFEEYAGLFAGQGDFDIPSTGTVGIAWKVTAGWEVLLDYQRINYEDVPSVSNPSYAPFPFDPTALGKPKLGDAQGPGFGWRNVNVVKLGTQITMGDWSWRAGWNHATNPVENQGVELMFNILAPGVVCSRTTAR